MATGGERGILLHNVYRDRRIRAGNFLDVISTCENSLRNISHVRVEANEVQIMKFQIPISTEKKN